MDEAAAIAAAAAAAVAPVPTQTVSCTRAVVAQPKSEELLRSAHPLSFARTRGIHYSQLVNRSKELCNPSTKLNRGTMLQK